MRKSPPRRENRRQSGHGPLERAEGRSSGEVSIWDFLRNRSRGDFSRTSGSSTESNPARAPWGPLERSTLDFVFKCSRSSGQSHRSSGSSFRSYFFFFSSFGQPVVRGYPLDGSGSSNHQYSDGIGRPSLHPWCFQRISP